MINICLIRHGETEWNAGEIFRGRADVELNETGIKQARLLADYIKDEPLRVIYSSPLSRALKTAETIAQYHGSNVVVTPGLIDMDYGQWQGLSHHAVIEKYRELYEEWLSKPHMVKLPEGESLGEVRTRVLGIVDKVIEGPGGSIALVSHRVVNKVLICALLGLDDSHFWNIKLDTCGITTFLYENKRFILTKHNDTSFLKSLARPASGDF
jgi:broad specificity phosphatase PhoE